MADENLKVAVNRALNKENIYGVSSRSDTAPIKSSELGMLKTLNASGMNISNLLGLGWAKQLEKIDLSNNKISSIESLKSLTRLEDVNLSNNRIFDFTMSSSPRIFNAEGQIVTLEECKVTGKTAIIEAKSGQVGQKLKNPEFSNPSEGHIQLGEGKERIVLSWTGAQKKSVSYFWSTKVQINTALPWEKPHFIETGAVSITFIQPIEFLYRDFQEVNMPDANLKKAVNVALNEEKIGNNCIRFFTDPVYKEELEQLSKIQSSDVSNLEGIQYAVTLTNLSLTSYKGSDISILDSLKKLEELNLSDGVQLKTLGKLSLPQLRRFEVTNTQIEDIDMLKNSSQLKIVNINNNRISNFTPLSGVYNNLSTFSAQNQQLSGSVQNLTGSAAIVNPLVVTLPDGTKVSNASNISDSGVYDSATGKITLPWTSNQNKNITYSYNELGGEITANVTQPVEFTHWQEVTMPDANLKAAVNEAMNHSGSGNQGLNGKSDRQPTDPVYKEELEQLGTLNLYSEDIQSLQGLEYATNLEWLDASNNKLPMEEFNYLKDLPRLSTLIASSQTVTSPMNDISFLSSMPAIQLLDISDWHVSDISPLRGKNLTYLKCNGNSISDFSPLGRKPMDFEAQGQKLSSSVQKVSGPAAIVTPVTITLPDGTKISTPTNISDSGVYDSATGKITLPWTSNQNKNITYSYNELGGEITANVTQPVEFTH
ncbi:leucine-rich repeat domain-containing protein, partial [Lactococcus garvieae]|uniref:leucine-rich repeat domain-containing protein n=1 Tax=Lactococcus garvieae TaxID=1363 RepID=UPI00254E2A0C